VYPFALSSLEAPHPAVQTPVEPGGSRPSLLFPGGNPPRLPAFESAKGRTIMTSKNPRDRSTFPQLAGTASGAAARPADRHPPTTRPGDGVRAHPAGARARALRPILSFALAAVWLAIAAPARGWDPMDAAGPPPDDPSAWHDQRGPARLAQVLERCATTSETDPSNLDGDDPSARRGAGARGLDCSCLASACAQLQSSGRGEDATAPSRTGRPDGLSPGSGGPSGPERTSSSIPPWFGSEPYVFGFEELAARPQTQVAPRKPTLATSLGSEPFPAGSGGPAPASDVTPVQRSTEPATLATSLGSEPLILEGAPPSGVAAAQAGEEPAAREELARTRR
jgi:hypothetical protein